jgi:hypothetical protein
MHILKLCDIFLKQKSEEKNIKWNKDIRTGTNKLYLQFLKEIQEVMETLQDDKNIESKYVK